MQKKVKGDGPTDRQTDRPTDTVTYRVAFTRLKTVILANHCTEEPMAGTKDGRIYECMDKNSYRDTKSHQKTI